MTNDAITVCLTDQINLACEQATVGDMTKENTASEVSRGGNCAKRGAGRGGTGGGRARHSLYTKVLCRRSREPAVH